MFHITEEALDRAMQLIKKGLEIIGENEILYIDMGYVCLMYIDAGIKTDESLIVQAEGCVQKAFALNPESSYGHYLKGMIQRKRRNTQESVREFKQSLAIDPNNPDSIMWLSWVYAHSGKVFAARPLIGKLLEIDPLTPLNHFWAGSLEVMDGKFDLAVNEFNKARQMEEENPLFLYWLAKALAYAQRIKEAHELFFLIERNSADTVWARLGTFFNHAIQDKKSEALQTATVEFKRQVKDDEMFPIWMAESYALINEKNEAIDWIEYAIKCGFINYPFLNEYDPFLANIRGEERFKKLMERVKYEWERFEV
jgi:tetratricopeptide (TPR) repeat protein